MVTLASHQPHHNAIGGFKAQGKTKESEQKIIAEAKQLEKLGCISIVLEAVPQHVGAAVRDAVSIPVVGVGAGVDVIGAIYFALTAKTLAAN